MATTDAGLPGAGRRRSLVRYAWTGFAGQVLLGLAMIAFVVAGSAYQRAAIRTNDQVHRLQLANLVMEAAFLDAGRSLRGYQLTGQDRFLYSYYADRAAYAEELRTARLLTWRGAMGGLLRESGVAVTAFRVSDQAIAVRRGSARARALYDQAARSSDRFVTANSAFGAQLRRTGAGLTAVSLRPLGVGLAAAAVIVAAAVMIPAAVWALGVSWILAPLQRSTDIVRRLAGGDRVARADAAGPAETRNLALSVNFLADESDRLRAEQEQRARLAAVVRETASQVREHLQEEEVIRETVRVVRQNLGSDFVWVSTFTQHGMALPPGNPEDLGLLDAALRSVPVAYPDYVGFMQDLYVQRSSYLVDVRSAEAAALPRPFLEALLAIHGSSLLSVPFGAGREVLGALTLLRTGGSPPWTPGERTAAESIAVDLGRGLDHARLYEQEKDLVEKLKDVDQAKSDFLAAVSHDLRTPLTSIVGYTEMLAEDQEPSLSRPQQEMVAAIDRNTARLGNLIEDVLTMSRIEMGEFRTVRRPVDLAAITRDAAAEIRPATEAKGLDFQLAGPASGLMVSGSGDQLDRALGNLLSNAVKYTPQGGRIAVTAGCQDGQAVVTVADTGIGIPASDQPSLFTRFYRASNVTGGAIPGTGLGLAIVRTIVDNHGGEIMLDSREDHGTTVAIRLPLLDEAATGAPGGDAR